MIAIGFLLALHLIQRDGQKNGLDPQFVSNSAFGCLILGILGTRVLHIIMFPEFYSWTDPIGWIAIWRGGLVFQGAFPLPLIYCWYVLRRKHFSFWLAADIAVPYIPLAHGFGRIGCFLNGCCYGCRTDLPWGLRFPRVPWDLSEPATGSPPYLDHCQRFSEMSMSVNHWSYPVHPTQLYGIVGLFAAFALLLYLRKHWRPFTGFTFPLYFILYSVGRFFVEFLRGDHNPTMGPFSEQQVFCIAFAVAGTALFAFLVYRQKGIERLGH